MEKYSFFVGIDISKLTIDVAVLDREKQRSEHMAFENGPKGFKAMGRWLAKFGDPARAFFCMEHTGIYAIPLCYYLSDNGHRYTLVPALAIKRSLGLQRGKSDKADARAIARFISLFHNEVETHVLPEEKLLKLKILLSQRERLIKAKTMFEVPARELKDYVDKGLTREVAKQSRESLSLLKKQIREIDNAMMELVKSDEQIYKLYKLATSVPGIGPQIGLNMLVATRCFTSFKDARKFACYCGIAPFEHASGSSIRGRTKVSNLANKKMKSLLSMGATSNLGHDPQTRQYYDRKRKEGKPPLLIMNAIKNRLVHRVFAAVKREAPYVKLGGYAA